MGCHGFRQTQGLNPCLFCLLHWQTGSLPLAPPGSQMTPSTEPGIQEGISECLLKESISAKEGSAYQEMAVSAASAPARMPLTQPHFCCFVLDTGFRQPKAVKFTSILASTGASCFQKNFPHCLSLEIPGRDGSPIQHAQLTQWAQRNGRKLGKGKKKHKLNSV